MAETGERALYAGWTFLQTERGCYVRGLADDGTPFERWYGLEFAAEWAVGTIIDAAMGKPVGEHSLDYVQRVVGPQIWSEALRITGLVGEEIAAQADATAASIGPGRAAA